MSYAISADILKRKDARDIGDLVSDDDTEVAVGDLADDANLQAALDDASGDIDAALLTAGRYTAAQLATLTGNALSHLKRITCEIAMYHLICRRPDVDASRLDYYAKLRESFLEPLRTGVNVFGLEDQIAAGQVAIDGPTTQERDGLNLFAREARGAYYPRGRMPDNR